VSILVMNMGHNESYSPFNNGANTTYDPRGLTTAVLQGNTNAVLTCRIQGSLGGENLWDPVRGPLNTGGLYGERYGWYLAFFNDFGWQQVSLPDSWAARQLPAGIGWSRTNFNLRLPENADVPIGLQINGGLGALTLFQYGNFSGGVPIQMVPAPQGLH
jgi:beta-galactosidase GanA